MIATQNLNTDMTLSTNAKPSILKLFACKCPRCRKGDMFVEKNPWKLKSTMKMHKECPDCGQPLDIEVGFYYGTGYMSYGITVALLVFNAVWWAIFIGFSWDNNSLYWYLGVSIAMMLVLQPWIMRLSRVMYLAMFVKYDRDHPVLSREEADAIPELIQGYIPKEHKPVKQSA